MSDPTIPGEDPPLGDPPGPSPPTTPGPDYDPGGTPQEMPEPDLPTTPDDDRPYEAAGAPSQPNLYGVVS